LNTRALVFCRLALLAVIFLGSISLLVQPARASVATPTVTVAPTPLSFGVPTQTAGEPATSAPQTVTVSNSGSSSVTVGVSSSSVTGTNAADFSVGNSTCGTTSAPVTVAASSSCSFDVTFTATQPAGTLETATVTVSVSSGNLSVGLSGAYGAIKLFTPVNVALSIPGASTSPYDDFDNTTIPLSCPVPSAVPDPPNPTGWLSSSPDGSGYIITDNYIFVQNEDQEDSSPQNICTGLAGNASGSCFTSAYQNAANGNSITGDDPDTFVNPGNSVLSGGAAGGLPPIDISGFYSAGGSVSLNVILQDTGGYVTSSTVFLVTNCTTPGTVAPGGTVSGNPVNPSVPSSLVQNFPIDTNSGDNINFDFKLPPTTGSSLAPTVTDIGITQETFATMMAGTSGGPAQCLHLNGEVDANGNTLCKAFLIECPSSSGMESGTNCSQAVALYEARFDAIEIPTPYNGYQFLTTTGPAWFMGSDNWVTEGSDGIGSPGTCLFSSSNPALYGQLCPQNPLTEFYGAADGQPGGPISANSLFIPAVDMPLPLTAVTSSTTVINGWNKTDSVTLAFAAAPPTYPPAGATACNLPLGVPPTPTGCAPPANGFIAAPIQSETYGYTAAPATTPDPTYPLSTDTVLSNPVPCPSNPTPGALPFDTTSTFALPQDGIYAVHYYAKDCAGTEELLFTPSGNSGQNWASYKTIEIGVDTMAPIASCGTPTPSANSNGWNNTAVTVACTATDQGYTAGTSGSGFAPLLANSIQGSPSENFNLVAAVPGAGWGTSVPATTSLTIADLAGNRATGIPTPTFNIDTVPPTITAPTLSPTGGSYTVGEVATVKYGCADVGSGIATCTDMFTGTGALPSCTGLTSAQTCTLDTSTTAVGSHKVQISATDLAGNSAGPAIASYSVAYVPVTLGILPLPAIASPGKTLTFVVLAGDITPAKAPVTAYGVNITTTLVITNTDLGTGAVTAKAGEVTCTAWPCTVTPSSGAACTVTSTPGTKTTTVAISCPIGTLVDLFSGKTAAGVSITVPIATKAPLGSITTSGGITSASPFTGTTTFSNFPVPII
jgi:hypothetical protein